MDQTQLRATHSESFLAAPIRSENIPSEFNVITQYYCVLDLDFSEHALGDLGGGRMKIYSTPESFVELCYDIKRHKDGFVGICYTKEPLAELDTMRNNIENFIGTLLQMDFFYGLPARRVTALACLLPDGTVIDTRRRNLEIRTLNEGYYERVHNGRLFIGPSFQFLSRAIDDIQMATQRVGSAPLYAFRAIETLRHFFEDKTDQDKRRRKLNGWNAMYANLRLERDDLMKDLENDSQKSRHGETTYVTADKNALYTGRAWLFCRRFIEFNHSGHLIDFRTGMPVSNTPRPISPEGSAE